MKRIVFCGSRKITDFSKVSQDIDFHISRVVEEGSAISIGDASGVDYEIQKRLAELGYANVTVWYCTNYPRNFMEDQNWAVEKVDGNYTQRDIAMCKDADELVAVWDNESKGTKRNIDSFSEEFATLICTGVNISSDTRGIGAALSINGKAARSRKLISSAYPVKFYEWNYDCAYDIYKERELFAPKYEKEKDPDSAFMIDIMRAKFVSNPGLMEKLRFRGGASWLLRCFHKPTVENKWQGFGSDSKYILALVSAYKLALEEIAN